MDKDILKEICCTDAVEQAKEIIETDLDIVKRKRNAVLANIALQTARQQKIIAEMLIKCSVCQDVNCCENNSNYIKCKLKADLIENNFITGITISRLTEYLNEQKELATTANKCGSAKNQLRGCR